MAHVERRRNTIVADVPYHFPAQAAAAR
jgi:hypothetical protein